MGGGGGDDWCVGFKSIWSCCKCTRWTPWVNYLKGGCFAHKLQDHQQWNITFLKFNGDTKLIFNIGTQQSDVKGYK